MVWVCINNKKEEGGGNIGKEEADNFKGSKGEEKRKWFREGEWKYLKAEEEGKYQWKEKDERYTFSNFYILRNQDIFRTWSGN